MLQQQQRSFSAHDEPHAARPDPLASHTLPPVTRPAVIALLTPYSGRNLGDGAIQTAFIENLRRLRPDIRLLGITEDPARTEAIHGIPCFPLRGVPAAEQVSRASVKGTGVVASAAGQAFGPGRLRKMMASLPLARPAAALARRLVKAPGQIAQALREARYETRLLREVDLLLVAGGGQLDEEWGGAWVQPFVLWRWTRLARRQGVVTAVASVGMGVLDTWLSRALVKSALMRCAYRSFRDEGTRTLLAQFAPVAHDPVVCDVALSLPASPNGGALPHSAEVVGLVPMVFGHAEHWPTVDVPAYERYLSELRAVVAHLASRGRIVVLFTSNRVDRVAVEDLLRGLDDSLVSSGRVRRVDSDSLPALLEALEACHVVIATRLHAVILAQRLARPVIAISFDRKVDEQMKQAGMAEFCVDIRSFTGNELLALIGRLASQAGAVRRQLETYVANAQTELARQFAHLLDLAERNKERRRHSR